jgi:hypothetical protein
MLFFRFLTICSARVSVSVTALSENPCERIGKWETLSDFQRGKIVGARLTGASLTKTATSLGVSRATLSKFISAHMNREKTTPAKKNSGRKSTLTEKDRPGRVKARKYRKSVARQGSGKHAPTTMGAGVFRGVLAKEFS